MKGWVSAYELNFILIRAGERRSYSGRAERRLAAGDNRLYISLSPISPRVSRYRRMYSRGVIPISFRKAFEK